VKLTPRNWNNFQHYKDRAPAWIKLHKELLDDYEFQCLPVASRALAPMLWLLASEYDNGVIEGDHKKLAFRLRMSEQEIIDALNPLISSGFFSLEQDASELLAERKPVAILEKRREEKSKRREREDISAEPSASSAGSIAFAAYADAYRERYQTDPVRNAKVNTIFANLAKQLGEDAAPVAAWYVRNEMLSTYVRSTHDPTLLLRDASGLCTRWKTGVAMTTKTARAADDSAGDVAMVQRVAARLENAMTVPMIAGNVVQLEDKRPLI
jgi:hypothetical protein